MHGHWPYSQGYLIYGLYKLSHNKYAFNLSLGYVLLFVAMDTTEMEPLFLLPVLALTDVFHNTGCILQYKWKSVLGYAKYFVWGKFGDILQLCLDNKRVISMWYAVKVGAIGPI